jgi:hypothetical protein
MDSPLLMTTAAGLAGLRIADNEAEDTQYQAAICDQVLLRALEEDLATKAPPNVDKYEDTRIYPIDLKWRMTATVTWTSSSPRPTCMPRTTPSHRQTATSPRPSLCGSSRPLSPLPPLSPAWEGWSFTSWYMLGSATNSIYLEYVSGRGSRSG